MDHIVFFSYNRAMQLDSVLSSVYAHLPVRDLYLTVVWHASGPHTDGYALLRRQYETRGVRFVERTGRPHFVRDVLPRLGLPRNLYHWGRYRYVRRADDFKQVVERVIAETPAEMVSFNTDDNIYYRDEPIPEAARAAVLGDPGGASYRAYVGRNLKDCPANLTEADGLLRWDYLDRTMYRHWAYPFSVDGTFYERGALLRTLRPVLYHNPVTLESFLLSYVKYRRLFRRGCSPLKASMIAVPLNKVSYIVAGNQRGDVSVEALNELFLDGFHLVYELPGEPDNSLYVPPRVVVARGDERRVLECAPTGAAAPV